MAYTNLNGLSNTSALELNTSLVNNSNTVVENFITNLNTQFPFWLFVPMVVLYLVLIWFLMKKQTLVALDFNRSNVLSSFLVTIVAGSIVLGGISNNIVPVTFFGFVWLVSLLFMFYVKKRG